MKFFHLADLHFGKTIYGMSMLDTGDQKYWTDRFLELCEAEKPQAVVIAGDVYDRANAGGNAVELLDYLLTRLAEMNIAVMLIAGNHDSGQQLSFGRSFLAKGNIHIAGSVQKEMEHVTLKDDYGEVTFWLMPYTFPQQISKLLEDDEIRNYDHAVRQLLARQGIDFSKRNVLIAHQNVVANGTEAKRGGSESMVGGVGQIDYTAFDGFDYVALGHIHSGYHVGRREVRYAGTPLCYHLEETRQPDKGAIMVELGRKGEEVGITPKVIKPLHKMRLLEDTRDEIATLLKDDKGTGEYIGIIITDQRITPELDQQFRSLLAVRNSVLVEIRSTYVTFSGNVSAPTADIKERNLEELFSELYTEQNFGTPPGEEEYELISYVAELVRNQDCHEPLRLSDIDKIVEKAEGKGNR